MLTISAILLSGCSSLNVNQKSSNESISKQSSLKFQSSVQPFFVSQNQQLQKKDSQQINIYMIVKQLKHNYNKLFKVKYKEDKDEINLIPTNKQVINIIKYSKQNNESGIKAWNDFVKGVKTTSSSVSKNSKDNQVKMNILDPQDNYSKLYIVQNGKVLFNKFK